jgi:hypothetical protein
VLHQSQVTRNADANLFNDILIHAFVLLGLLSVACKTLQG